MNESRPLAFSKMHGLGNDFIVIDNMSGDIELDADRVRRMSDRRTGIGFDQLLVVEPSDVAEASFDYRIYNADGSEVEHCGNGARCFARFVHERGLTTARDIIVNTSGGLVELHLRDDGDVTVGMGVPTFTPAEVPFRPDHADDTLLPGQHRLEVDGEILLVGVVGIGNPHVVVTVDDIDSAPVASLGPRLESDPRFPNRVNVGFVQHVNEKHLLSRVFERGVGETRACGTGACAAVACGQAQGLLDRTVRVTLSGGDLTIFRANSQSTIEMTGPCSTVFEGHTRM